jgi:hypothetical protein
VWGVDEDYYSGSSSDEEDDDPWLVRDNDAYVYYDDDGSGIGKKRIARTQVGRSLGH